MRCRSIAAELTIQPTILTASKSVLVMGSLPSGNLQDYRCYFISRTTFSSRRIWNFRGLAVSGWVTRDERAPHSCYTIYVLRSPTLPIQIGWRPARRMECEPFSKSICYCCSEESGHENEVGYYVMSHDFLENVLLKTRAKSGSVTNGFVISLLPL